MKGAPAAGRREGGPVGRACSACTQWSVLHGGEGDGDDECDPEAQAAPLQQRARAQPPRPQHRHKPDRQPPADGVAQAEAYRALEGGPYEPDVLVQRHFPVNEEAKRPLAPEEAKRLTGRQTRRCRVPTTRRRRVRKQTDIHPKANTD
eukprot:scaffold116223_cov63-Phaeocystis_antarctica.AAC.1